MSNQSNQNQQVLTGKYRPGEISVRVNTLIEYLYYLPQGTIVEWDDLSQVIGCDAQQHRHVVSQATMMLQRDHAQMWDNVRGIGIKRLNDVEGSESVESILKRVRNMTYKGLMRHSRVDSNNLSIDEKIAHDQRGQALGVTHKVLAPRKQKAIRGVTAQASNIRQIGQTVMKRQKQGGQGQPQTQTQPQGQVQTQGQGQAPQQQGQGTQEAQGPQQGQVQFEDVSNFLN